MKYIFILSIIILFSSCNWFKKKAKDTVNRSGEIAAKTGSEFVNGVSKGIAKTFKNQVIFSEELKQDGLKAGKIIINSTDSSTDNIITAYLIFDKDFDKNITVKVFSEEGQEYGRVTKNISGKKGEAKFFDFFDKRTNIDGRGKLTFK